MKIIQIGPYPVSADCIRGGIESSVYGLAQAQAKLHDVVCLDFPRLKGSTTIEHCGNIIVYRFLNPGIHNEDAISCVTQMVQIVLHEKPDYVHIHGTGQISYAIYKKIRILGVQPFVTIHGLLAVEKWNQLCQKISFKSLYQFIKQSWIECRFISCVPHAIVDTDYLVTALQKYPIRKLPKLHIIPQGINEKYYHLTTLQIVERELQPIILCVAAFSQRKSQMLLVQAYEVLRERLGAKCAVCPRLVLVGVVSDEKYYNRLWARVEKSPYKADIDVGRDLSQEELMQQYAKAYIFALPSQEESQGIVLAEAMAAGLPVVATRVGGVPYVVSDEVAGLLSNYGDVEGMADNLCRLLEDKKAWLSMSMNARELARQYEWTVVSDQILSIYHQLQCNNMPFGK